MKFRHILADGTELGSIDGYVIRDIPENKGVYLALAQFFKGLEVVQEKETINRSCENERREVTK
jgi:hypothetical protein